MNLHDKLGYQVARCKSLYSVTLAALCGHYRPPGVTGLLQGSHLLGQLQGMQVKLTKVFGPLTRTLAISDVLVCHSNIFFFGLESC